MPIGNGRINVVRWKDIDKWVVPRTSLVAKLPAGWTSRLLKDLVKPITQRERVESGREYRMVGVKWYGEGLFHRETVRGGDLSSKWVNPVIPEAFIYNRLFAWKESFAVVPNEYKGYYVSSEFPQFVVDKSVILPEYLYLVFTRSQTVEIMKRLSVGSSAVSRNRFKEQDFLNLHIPLPPLVSQIQIVRFWENACQKVSELQKSADDYEKGLQHTLMDELGIKENGSTEQQTIMIVKYSETERWDTFFFRREFCNLVEKLRQMNALPLKKCVKFASRKWAKSDFPDGFFNYIQISDVNDIHGITGSTKVYINHAPSRATQIVRHGDILISTTRPYLAAFAMVPKDYDGSVASSGFAVVETTIRELDKDFLLSFLKSYAGLKQFEQRMTGGLYPAIVQTALQKILVPVPPLSKQRHIVEKVNILQEGARNMRTMAGHIIANAKTTLDKVITGERSIEDVMDG